MKAKIPRTFRSEGVQGASALNPFVLGVLHSNILVCVRLLMLSAEHDKKKTCVSLGRVVWGPAMVSLVGETVL